MNISSSNPPPEIAAAPPGGLSRGPGRAARGLVGALALGAVIYAAYGARPELARIGPELHVLPAWSYAFAFALSAAVLATEGLMWRRALEDLSGHRLPLGESALVFFAGCLGKYVPGKVWTVVFQTTLLAKNGIGLAATASLSAVLSALSLLGALTTAGICAAFLPSLPPALRIGGACVAAATIAGSVALALSRGFLVRRFPENLREPLLALGRRIPLYVAGFAVAWLGHGLTAAVFVGAAQGCGWESAFLLVAAMIASAVAGALALIAPAGLGVREAVLYAALSRLPPGLRITLPVVTRAVLLAAEAAGYVVSAAVSRIRRKK